MGASFHHGPRFRRPPCDPGRWAFPSPVLTLASLRSPSHTARSFSADSHTPLRSLVGFPGRSLVHRPTVRGLLELPRAQSPFACARSDLAHRGLRTTSAGVPLRPRSYGLMRRSSTLPVPTDDPWSTGLCRLRSAPAGRRTFPTFSLRLFPCVLGPLPRRLVWCTYPCLPTRQRPSPREDRVGAPPCPYSDFRTARLARLQSFTHVQAHRCARHPGRSYRHITLWQPWLLRPSLSRVVTSPCPGYAYRPHRAIDGMGTCTPSDTQPCRLLPATVGTPVTRRPPCSPGRAVFPHPVPRLHSHPCRAEP